MSFGPKRLQVNLVAQCVHRLPETLMREYIQLTVLRQPLKRLALPERLITLNAINDAWRKHKEAAINFATIPNRLLFKCCDFALLNFQGAKTTWLLHGGNGCRAFTRLMRLKQFKNIN